MSTHHYGPALSPNPSTTTLHTQVMLAVTQAGALYRSFFLWMLQSVLLLNYDKMAQDLATLSKSSKVRPFLQALSKRPSQFPLLYGTVQGEVLLHQRQMCGCACLYRKCWSSLRRSSRRTP